MGLIVIEFVSQHKQTGVWEYRRRVPKKYKGHLANTGFRKTLTEFKKALGTSKEDALKQYPNFHALVEKALRKAEQNLTGAGPDAFEGLTKLEIFNLGLERVRRMGFDPYFDGVGDDDPDSEAEAHARGLIADEILEEYPLDKTTGHPQGVTAVDRFVVRTLNHTAPKTPDPTLDDAVKLYKAERIAGTAFEVKKKTQRLERLLSCQIASNGDPFSRPITTPSRGVNLF